MRWHTFRPGAAARGISALIGALVLLNQNEAHALEPDGVSIVIGPENAVVVERYRASVSAREARLQWEVPAGIDLSSLSVEDSSGKHRVLEWRSRPILSSSLSTGEIHFAGANSSQDRAPETGWQIEAHVRGPGPGRAQFESRYLTDRIRWRAVYDVIIRGDLANHLEPLSIDLEGRCLISNALSRAFSRAQVRVKGVERDALEAPRKPRGFLWLDPDSPLADLWRPRPPEKRPAMMYAISEPVTVLPGAETMVRIASGRRVPAERVYVMDSDRVSLTGSFQPLSQVLTFRNERRFGLGTPLPPGIVRLSAGAGRSTFRKEGRLPPTLADAPVRVEIGPLEAVSGSRRSLGRSVSRAGFTEETVELRIANRLPSPVSIEIFERPPVPLGWDVTRSTHPFQVISRRLFFEINVAARSEERITYTVRLTEPPS